MTEYGWVEKLCQPKLCRTSAKRLRLLSADLRAKPQRLRHAGRQGAEGLTKARELQSAIYLDSRSIPGTLMHRRSRDRSPPARVELKTLPACAISGHQVLARERTLVIV